MNTAITSVFQKQQAYKLVLRDSTAQQRISSLKKLKLTIEAYEEEIYEALFLDLRKNKMESAITEVLFIYSELDFALKNTKRWMKPKRAKRTITSLLAKSTIQYQPKGSSLIIAPWNYPFQLTMSPLISAISAGNSVIIKPSEYSPNVSKIIKKIIDIAFEENQIACFEGDQSISEQLLQLPFDHIFFTGSPQIGKIVMKAAAENLSSITLELGGKSPVIIDQNTDIKGAADKIAWGKLINAGQTCIAPDYVFVHQNKLQEFIKYYKSATKKMFFHDDGTINTQDYARIINQRHANRLKDILDDAVKNGADLYWGGTLDSELTFTPTILCNPALNSRIMQEEIFGPILPIIPYKELSQVIKIINEKPKPLAFYIFSKNKKTIEHLLKNIPSGGACINDVIVHVSNPNLPFGGINGSGMGSCHGIYGFKSFSHERAIVYQSKLQPANVVYPPYYKKHKIINLLKKFM
ncbi:aldehyde dehydrogenase family protein [Sphingobacterium sp. UT-1RO-CII-1]|uniref:aldehyde dehydrogenase family protein n=1 Tax=Sphingobacterium sp. UT-1RO-CII-1 TaxID=2995225 RepID=UPI00227D4380|nr:aldehyde dehydrogenase family protein [Sphingobacterium sp. UT-1RO-CII-1]MCY4781341.1 aldehyde dehydrogenase family protein [Sphingobacterium sp. UT-1RO-CII-1]